MKKEKIIKMLRDIKNFFKKKLNIKDKHRIMSTDGDVDKCIYDSIERLRAITRIKNYIKDNFGYDHDDWADWGNEDEKKYVLFLFFHNNNKEIRWDFFVRTKYSSFIGYLKSEEDCKKLIKNCEKDLELILK